MVEYAESRGIAPRSSPPEELGGVHGVVLAGAYPRGQAGLDSLRPRPLLPVAGQPLIAYALRWMKDGGLPAASVCANTATRTIQAVLGRGSEFGMRLDYQEDWTPRGAAGIVRDAGVKTDADTFVVADATTVPMLDLGALLTAHRTSGAAITVVASASHGAGGNGTRGLQPAGVYVFARRVLEHLPAAGFHDIKESLIPRLYRSGEHVLTYPAAEAHPRVVSTDTYLMLNQWVLERASRLGGPPPGFSVSGEALIHDSASVASSARLIGPVVVGSGASVQARASVVGPASIGSHSVVERDAVVSRSVLWSECVVRNSAFVDRCVLTDSVRVRAGESLLSSLKVSEERLRPRSNRPRQWARLPWVPVSPALRPPAANGL